MNLEPLKPLRAALLRILKAISTSEHISEHATCVPKMLYLPQYGHSMPLCGVATASIRGLVVIHALCTQAFDQPGQEGGNLQELSTSLLRHQVLRCR